MDAMTGTKASKNVENIHFPKSLASAISQENITWMFSVWLLCPKRSNRSISDRKLSRLARHKHQQIIRQDKHPSSESLRRARPTSLGEKTFCKSEMRVILVFLESC